MIQEDIRKLVAYGLETGLLTEADKIYTTNRLLELFGLDELAGLEEGKDAGISGTGTEGLDRKSVV